MISVIIATQESERALVPTLAALVPGVLAGIVQEVIIADAGSQDHTAAVADAGGCRFVVSQAPVGGRLKAGAVLARGNWLLFLRPGAVLDSTWVEETSRFMQDAELMGDRGAAVFRPGGAAGRRRPLIVEALALFATALGALPRPEQGLLILKRHYDELGGHRAESAKPESAMLRQVGRRRIALLRSAAVMVAN